MDLLTERHGEGRRFEPVNVVESGDRVAVELPSGGFKVFTFAGDDLLLMQDCVDRDDALARLAA